MRLKLMRTKKARMKGMHSIAILGSITQGFCFHIGLRKGHKYFEEVHV
jgi:hypothetical protein